MNVSFANTTADLGRNATTLIFMPSRLRKLNRKLRQIEYKMTASGFRDTQLFRPQFASYFDSSDQGQEEIEDFTEAVYRVTDQLVYYTQDVYNDLARLFDNSTDMSGWEIPSIFQAPTSILLPDCVRWHVGIPLAAPQRKTIARKIIKRYSKYLETSLPAIEELETEAANLMSTLNNLRSEIAKLRHNAANSENQWTKKKRQLENAHGIYAWVPFLPETPLMQDLKKHQLIIRSLDTDLGQGISDTDMMVTALRKKKKESRSLINHLYKFIGKSAAPSLNKKEVSKVLDPATLLDLETVRQEVDTLRVTRQEFEWQKRLNTQTLRNEFHGRLPEQIDPGKNMYCS